jgi:prenyltransferase beta subunit
MVDRRTFLITVGVGSVGAGAAFGTDAFSTVKASRNASVQIADDDEAVLALRVLDGGERYANINDGQLELDFSTGEKGGLGPRSRYTFGDVFEIVNQGTQNVTVSAAVDGVESTSGITDFELYDTESGRSLTESGSRLSVGEALPTGIEIETQDVIEGPVKLDVILSASADNSTGAGPTVQSATATDATGNERAEVFPGRQVVVEAAIEGDADGIESVVADASAFGLSEQIELSADESGPFSCQFTIDSISATESAAVTVTVTSVEGVADVATTNTLDIVDDPPARWIERTIWPTTGSAIDFPGFVVYPLDSLRATRAIELFDRGAEVKRWDLGAAAVRLQANSGGFFARYDQFLGPWVYATHGAVVLADRYDLNIDTQGAIDFLKRMQTDAGGFSPRPGLNQPRIAAWMEATASAVAALDRLGALDSEIRSQTVEFLWSEQRDGGGWPQNTRTNETDIHGTYFALLTLDRLDALDADTREQAEEYLLGQQMPSGGFRTYTNPVRCGPVLDPPVGGCAIGPEVTARATARAILGLEITGYLDDEDRRKRLRLLHAGWLLDRRFDDPDDPRLRGGFENFQLREPPVVDYRTNTQAALRALRTLNASFDPDPSVRFLLRCQHPGSRGFGSIPSYLSTFQCAAAAIRALDVRGRQEAIPSAELAATLSRQQSRDGYISELDWGGQPAVTHTGWALLMLDRIGRVGAVDVESAVDFISSRQQDSGAFADSEGRYVTPKSLTTCVALRALAAVDRLDAVDTSEAAEYLADTQNDDGSISTENLPYTEVRDTRLAIDALNRADELDAIDQETATGYLTAAANAHNSIVEEIGQGLLGLATLNELNRIDLTSIRSHIRGRQFRTGSYVPRRLYYDGPNMERHSTVVEAVELLRQRISAAEREYSSAQFAEPSAESRVTNSADTPSDVGRQSLRLADAGWVGPQDALREYWEDP